MTNEIKNEMVVAMMDYGVIHTWQENGKVFWQTMGVKVNGRIPQIDTDHMTRHFLWMTDGVDWDDAFEVLSAIHDEDNNVGDPYKETWFEL